MNDFALNTNQVVPNIVPPPYKVTFSANKPKTVKLLKKLPKTAHLYQNLLKFIKVTQIEPI